MLTSFDDFPNRLRFIVDIRGHTADVVRFHFGAAAVSFFAVLPIESRQAVLKNGVFLGIMNVAVKQNRAAMLPVPHENRIMAQNQLDRFAPGSVGNFFVIANIVVELSISRIGQVVVVPFDKNFAPFQLRDVLGQTGAGSAHRHIADDVDGVRVGDFTVPSLHDDRVHFFEIGERPTVEIAARLRYVFVKEMKIGDVVIHLSVFR